MSVTDLFREKVRFAELIKIIFLQFYIFFFINVGKVFVQSSLIEKKFVKKYKFSNTEVMPFYEEPKNLANNKSKKYDFCYISLSHPHKQHNMLLIAFEKLLAKGYAISCALTVDSSDKKLLDKIFYLNKKYKAKIENFGVVPRKKLRAYIKTQSVWFSRLLKKHLGYP